MFRVGDTLESFDTARYRREDIRAGESLEGPAILLQGDSTTVVPPGWRFEADRFDNLLLETT